MLKSCAILVLRVWAVAGERLRGRRGGRSCHRKRCPLQAPLGHGCTDLPVPSACRTGCTGSPSVWHACNLHCSQDCPFSLPWQHNFGHAVSVTILWQVATIFCITSWLLCLYIALWLPGPGTACHFTQHYVRKGSFLFLHMETTVWDKTVCEVCNLMLNFK